MTPILRVIATVCYIIKRKSNNNYERMILMKEVTITKANFESEVINSDIPVLVDFWAAWCGPCKMLSPVLAEIAQEYEGKVKVAKVNIDEEGELAVKYGIMSIPTVLLFKDGQLLNKSVGFTSKENLVKMAGI